MFRVGGGGVQFSKAVEGGGGVIFSVMAKGGDGVYNFYLLRFHPTGGVSIK